MLVQIYKNTNFGNNDLVWNVPHPDYDYTQHETQIFTNVHLRFPLLTTGIIVEGEYNFNSAFYDYMIITDDLGNKTYYFINTIIAERNILIFSVTLDAISTYNMLEKPITGILVRKHDTNLNEHKFDYPTALKIEPNYYNEYYTMVSYIDGISRFIESTVNLSKIDTAYDMGGINVPRLPKPNHVTKYNITAWGGNQITDDNRAFTLYRNDLVSDEVLNTVRGLSGDGAISDSYAIPSEAILVSASGAEVTNITSRFLTKTANMKMEIDFSTEQWQPTNEVIKGMFSVAIMSLQEKTRAEFQAWDIQESVDENNNLKVNLWCDPKPSGAPYCCPDQVLTLYPLQNSGTLALATLEGKSVRGGQWLRNPLIYSSGKGEIFATIETRLQREKADYEKQVSLQQLEIARREREIQIAQHDYNYQSGLASSIIGGGASLVSKDWGGMLSQAKGAMDSVVNRNFVEQMRDLQSYQMQSEKQLINMAHTNNLKNLNVQENIRRVVPREVVFAPNESMGSYENYNAFMIIKIVPDMEALKAKDMEYSKYGYPVYERVTDFNMLDHLRQNHTVFQFEKPFIEIGGQIGDMVRTVLQSGIRILSKKYTSENILNNPKVGA